MRLAATTTAPFPRWCLPGALLILLAPVCARAHPVAQGAMEVTVAPDHIELRARVSTEEVFVQHTFAAEAGRARATDLAGAWRDHGRYLREHLRVFADHRLLAGQLVEVLPPPDVPSASRPADRVAYIFRYGLADAKPPAAVRVEEDVLNEISYAPGNRWEASYVVRIGQENRTAAEGLLLTSRDPVNLTCDWTVPTPDETAGAKSVDPHAGLDRWKLFTEYVHHGVMHILTGYDHLLFISALALATITLWDLVKVISAFTLAHTCTLTLATLNIVRLPEHVVEPMIAGSIVFVALQNVFWPERSRGGTRLMVAFFFGLFHGLGFAGGLLEAMENLPGVAVTLAIAAFSIGVELGHQAVVLPLFFGMKWLRASRPDARARAQATVLTLRYGSVVISLAGIYYLAVALHG